MTDSGLKFEKFVDIVTALRAENGCPWDREQTPLSLRRYLREESNELLESLDSGDHLHIMEELGDLLYIIVLLARIYNEKDLFDIGAVIDSISAKMIRRHPHVFADEKIGSVEELRAKWLEIKDSEKAHRHKAKKN